MNSIMIRNRGIDRMMDRVFDGFMNTIPSYDLGTGPAVDVREETDRYVLEAELPGLSEKDVDVKVENNLLTISAKQAENAEAAQGSYLIRERRSRSFSRSFVLPAHVDRDAIEAHFRNGVLNLVLQKTPAAKPRTIEVKVAG